MHLVTVTNSLDCTMDDGLAHIVLNQPDRGNPIDGQFCREFSLCIAELSGLTCGRSCCLRVADCLASAAT